MENQNKLLRDIKIAKRHSPGGVFIGLLCLVAIVIPILLWLPTLNWFQVRVDVIPEQSSWSYQYQAGIYFLNPLNLLKNLFGVYDEGTEFIINNAVISSCLIREAEGLDVTKMDVSYYIIKENLAEAAIWYLASAVIGVVIFVKGLVLLFRGRLHNNFSIVLYTGLYALCNGMLLCSAWRLGYYTGGTMKKVFALKGVEAANVYQYILWPNYILAGAAAALFLIVLIIYLATMCRRYYPEDLIVIEPRRPSPYETNDGVVRNTLPRGIKVFGNHMFAKNLNLEIATIEHGVTELGVGTFSNCLRLKVVNLPVTIKRIRSNCFFNCAQLKRINYGGTKKQWKKVVRGSNWLARAGSTTVLCSDGAISVNPYH